MKSFYEFSKIVKKRLNEEGSDLSPDAQGGQAPMDQGQGPSDQPTDNLAPPEGPDSETITKNIEAIKTAIAELEKALGAKGNQPTEEPEATGGEAPPDQGGGMPNAPGGGGMPPPMG